MYEMHITGRQFRGLDVVDPTSLAPLCTVHADLCKDGTLPGQSRWSKILAPRCARALGQPLNAAEAYTH